MADNLNYSKVKSDSGVEVTPVGTILPWTKATAPVGFLLCDGTAVSRSTYSDLFGVIGTTYGVGDGSTTFNVPDMKSRCAVGANATSNVAQTGGAHDTTGAGLTLQNNLTAVPFDNLAVTTTENLSFPVTENLAVGTTQNLAASVTNSLTGSITENLAVNTTQNLAATISGTVSSHTLTLGELASHEHPQNLYGNANQTAFPNPRSAGLRTASAGNAGGSGGHGHNTNLAFNLTGTAVGAKSGAAGANIAGTINATLTGTANKAIAGAVTVAKTGAVTTTTTGSVSANITGDVTVQNVSLYSPNLVVTYIIKH